MRFLLRLQNYGKYSAEDAQQLSKEAYEKVRTLEADVGNLRVSSSAVELDLLLPDDSNLRGAITILERIIGQLLTLRELDVNAPPLDKTQAIELGLDLFNEERYWESHEAFEMAWGTTVGSEKEILHALILIAAALVHLQKNEPEISLSIMKRASAILTETHGRYCGIELARVQADVRFMVLRNTPQFFKIDRTCGDC